MAIMGAFLLGFAGVLSESSIKSAFVPNYLCKHKNVGNYGTELITYSIASIIAKVSIFAKLMVYGSHTYIYNNNNNIYIYECV